MKRFLTAAILVALLTTTATAGPILDRIRANCQARRQANGSCQQSGQSSQSQPLLSQFRPFQTIGEGANSVASQWNGRLSLGTCRGPGCPK